VLNHERTGAFCRPFLLPHTAEFPGFDLNCFSLNGFFDYDNDNDYDYDKDKDNGRDA